MLALQFATAQPRIWLPNAFRFLRPHGPIFIAHNFSFGGPLLVLSCLGQAADVLASTARSSAFGSTFKATPKLERVPQWGSA